LFQKINIMLIFLLVVATSGFADGYFLPDYYEESDFLFSTPSVAGDGIGAYFNPGAWGMVEGPEFQFIWDDKPIENNDTTSASRFLTLGSGSMFFALKNNDYLDITENKRKSLTDYQIGMSSGNKGSRFGWAYGWSKGDNSNSMPRSRTLSVGMVERRNRYFSSGLVGKWALSGGGGFQAVYDIGGRPLGNEMVTLFADATMRNTDSFRNVQWSAGVLIEPIAGVSVHGKFFRNYVQGNSFLAGLSLTVSGVRASTTPHFDSDDGYAYNSYGIRVGLPTRDFITEKYIRDKAYLNLRFNRQIKYQRYKLFDNSGHTLMELLTLLEDVKNDGRISGLAINITEEMSGSWELIWEVREKIKDVQSAGKKVVVFLERGGMRQYYLASVADRLMVDPVSYVAMMGFNMGRTYYRNALDKYGVGIDEWRFFKYKSAAEGLSRTSMTDADREQRHAIIEGFYETLREDICASRGITYDEFDYVVNNVAVLNADSLLAYNLIDTTGRPDNMSELIEYFDEDGSEQIIRMMYSVMRYRSNEWGLSPQVAVIYALGPCSMNSGINARRLRHVIKAARENDRIKAVVLRVDSPGGDILPSDIVADELRKTAEEKPVIISQGWVAASGGYWISMYGDQIVASPWTITGSIGVIGLMVYNDSLGSKLGLTYDHTQVGDHADLFSGINIPLLGTIPDRNLNAFERSFMEKEIKLSYNDFITKVADGRDMDKDAVHEIAQGRVWTGKAGIENGLIDELGGLELAIRLATEAADIDPGMNVEITELPSKGLINPAMFQPKLLGIKVPYEDVFESNTEIQYLRMIVYSKGRPMVLAPPFAIE